MHEALAAFVGAYTALIVMAEVQMQSKIVKYLVGLVAGLLLTVVLSLVLGWMTDAIAKL